MEVGDFLEHHRRRIAVACTALLIIIVIALSDAMFESIERGIGLVGNLVVRHPTLGVLAFVAFSALSAMLAFVSTAVLVPIGIGVWGDVGTMALLWSGWLIGGAAAYAIGRFLGRGIVRLLLPKERLQRYEGVITHRIQWPAVLLFQLAVPSEVPGYMLGIVRYPFGLYLLALGIAELPFAAGAVYLGKGFLARNWAMMIGFGAAGILLMIGAVAAWHRRQRSSE